jgi:hypothetical protein
MDTTILKDKVRHHVADARIVEALNILKAWATNYGSTEARNNYALIESAWNTLKNEKIQGIAENVFLRTNQI